MITDNVHIINHDVGSTPIRAVPGHPAMKFVPPPVDKQDIKR